jgi:hypothetical protein
MIKGSRVVLRPIQEKDCPICMGAYSPATGRSCSLMLTRLISFNGESFLAHVDLLWEG